MFETLIGQYVLWFLVVGTIILFLLGWRSFLRDWDVRGMVNYIQSPLEVMPAFITAALMTAGLFVILSDQYDATNKHWAYGTIGTLVGYWFRPPRTSSRRGKSN